MRDRAAKPVPFMRSSHDDVFDFLQSRCGITELIMKSRVEQPGFLRHQVVELGYLKSAHGHDNESVAFNVQPRSTGQVLIGSSRQYDAGPSLLAPMLRRAFEYMPGLAGLSVIRTWHGFRAATPDSLPIIGPIDGGPWAATGHEGLGITTSLGTAQLLTDQLLWRPTAIPCEPYLPSRFSA